MKFNKENIKKYNLYENKTVLKCSVCNKETKFIDYWCDDKFCSTECQEKYYNWLKRINRMNNIRA